MKLWLASYPRSGNTYFRNVLYEVYGVRSSTFHDEADYPLDENYAEFSVVKTHLLPAQLIPRNPDIPAVYLVRDGRDCAVSLARYRQELFQEVGDYDQFVYEAIEASGGSHFGGWSRHVREWRERADLVIRFEDLIVDPIGSLEQLRPWLDLPQPDIDKLPTFEQLRQQDHRYGSGLEHGFSEEERDRWRKGKFRRGKPGAWRDELSVRQQLHFLSRHGGELESLEYEIWPEESVPLSLPQQRVVPVSTQIDGDQPRRVVIDGVKLIDPLSDGIRRYVWELISALDEIADEEAPGWSIDVSLGSLGMVPLREIADDDSEDKSYLANKLPPLLWPGSDNPLAVARRKLVASKGKSFASRFVKFLDYKRLSLMRSVAKRVHRWTYRSPLKVDEYDLLHLTLPNSWHHFRSSTPPVLTTVHDLCHLECPELQISSNVEPLRQGLEWSESRGASYIAVSQATRDQMVAQLALPAERIHVVPNSVRTDHFHPGITPSQIETLRTDYGIPNGPFLLCLGTIEPRKNLPNVVRAFQELTESNPDLPLRLVIAGSIGWGNHCELHSLIDRNPRICPIGFVADEHLPALYAAARALCYVSLYEGFGLPLLEAMACGTPVVYGDNSAMPEVAAAGGLPATATDVNSIQAAMLQIVRDDELHRRLAMSAVRQAHRVSWIDAARQTLQAYRAAIASQAAPTTTTHDRETTERGNAAA